MTNPAAPLFRQLPRPFPDGLTVPTVGRRGGSMARPAQGAAGLAGGASWASSASRACLASGGS